MRRVVVMGPPGSGKSTLARRIGKRHGLPVFHLDQAFWQAGWVETPPAEFAAAVARTAALPAWVIDGNYTFTLAPRLARADTVIHLGLPAGCPYCASWPARPRATARCVRTPRRAARSGWTWHACATPGRSTGSAAAVTWRPWTALRAA